MKPFERIQVRIGQGDSHQLGRITGSPVRAVRCGGIDDLPGELCVNVGCRGCGYGASHDSCRTVLSDATEVTAVVSNRPLF
jgi:hypothetical protein